MINSIYIVLFSTLGFLVVVFLGLRLRTVWWNLQQNKSKGGTSLRDKTLEVINSIIRVLWILVVLGYIWSNTSFFAVSNWLWFVLLISLIMMVGSLIYREYWVFRASVATKAREDRKTN